MADLQVIYDPELEIAAIVNIDTRLAWGPAMVGPNAGEILRVFVEESPFDVSELDTYTAGRMFTSFLTRAGLTAQVEANASDQDAMGASIDQGMGDADVIDTSHGAPTDEPPAIAPADSDPEADASPETTIVTCSLCSGTGMVNVGDDNGSQQCGLCRGSGKVTIAAAT